MTDGIIKGNGASRYLKTVPSGLSQYPTYEDFMQALVEGTFPVDLFGRNPGGWAQEGTLLNKASLLSDEEAARQGLGSDAKPNDMWPGLVPIGSVFWLASETIPARYLRCDGAEVSRTDYAKLFAVIGTVFGAGNGSTTFSLPDLRAAFIRGSGQNGSFSATFGKAQNPTGLATNAYGPNSEHYALSYEDPIFNDDATATSSYLSRPVSKDGYGNPYSTRLKYFRPYNYALTPIIRY